jgi:hypothetical protein
MSTVKIARSVFCLALVLAGLCACQGFGGKGIPEELRGVWVTEAKNYERCSSLEITGERLIFENGIQFIDINDVTKVERTPEGDTPLYNIHDENRDGYSTRISVLFMKTAKGGVLCFKNQRNILSGRNRRTPDLCPPRIQRISRRIPLRIFSTSAFSPPAHSGLPRAN